VLADSLHDYAVWRRPSSRPCASGPTAGASAATATRTRSPLLAIALVDGIGVPLALGDPQITVAAAIDDMLSVLDLWVPRTSSTSRDQAIFVDQAADVSVPSDVVLLKIDRPG
jgi:hypothetical protein